MEKDEGLHVSRYLDHIFDLLPVMLLLALASGQHHLIVLIGA